MIFCELTFLAPAGCWGFRFGKMAMDCRCAVKDSVLTVNGTLLDDAHAPFSRQCGSVEVET
jgi:hypothetical protein